MSRGLPRILGFEEGMTKNVIIEHQEPSVPPPSVETIDNRELLKANHNYLVFLHIRVGDGEFVGSWVQGTYLTCEGQTAKFRVGTSVIDVDLDEAVKFGLIGKTHYERSRDQGPGVQS